MSVNGEMDIESVPEPSVGLGDSSAVIESVALCEICNKQPRVYKCPRCAMFTCSLQCVRDHKLKVI